MEINGVSCAFPKMVEPHAERGNAAVRLVDEADRRVPYPPVAVDRDGIEDRAVQSDAFEGVGEAAVKAVERILPSVERDRRAPGVRSSLLVNAGARLGNARPLDR